MESKTSTKLKALDAEINVLRGQPRYVTTHSLVVLNALPQIVAVVEAAEKSGSANFVESPLAAALAALDEALS